MRPRRLLGEKVALPRSGRPAPSATSCEPLSLISTPRTSVLRPRYSACCFRSLYLPNNKKMANNDANMSDGEQTSPSRARNRPRGRERERRRRRSRFRSRSRSRSRGRRGYLRSPERRDSSHCSPPRDRSPAPRNVPLVIERTTSCEHLVIPTIQSYRNSTGHHRKIRSYHDEVDEVVLVPSAPMPKPKQRCKREIFDEYEHVSHQNKRQRPLEMPKVDKPKHQPVLSFDGQSTEGFMDFEDVLSSLLQPTTFKPRKSVFFAAQETPQGMSTDQATHPDSMRGFSDGADMNADNNDTLTSDSIEAPRGHRPAPEVSRGTLHFLFTYHANTRFRAPTPSSSLSETVAGGQGQLVHQLLVFQPHRPRIMTAGAPTTGEGRPIAHLSHNYR